MKEIFVGYCIDMEVNVKIPLSKEKEIKQAFKNLEDRTQKNGSGGTYSPGKVVKHYSWVDHGFSKLDTVEEMFEEWRYEVIQENEFYVIKYWTGEKIGDDDQLWKEMASLVDPNSVIECRGEDGAHWKYTFKKNKFEEIYGKVTYGEDEDEVEENPKAKKKKTTVKKTDHWAVLGLKSDATKKDINAAYKELIAKYHPDKFANLGTEFEAVALAKTQELNESRNACLKKAKK